ncbi:DUF3883 domain-containing protein [Virgibacillus necropolis]|uniref:protein NO VEIN domain-containing protein n=1 Tax=Virgibacillus necropolis TaxID=163877 RepID=UPI00384BEBCD
MNSNRNKVLVIAYYLSKYNRRALLNLNYNTFKDAYDEASNKLGFKPNTIKNRRDDFDSIHDNGRSGWYQKELPKRSLEIVNILKNLSEDALTEIVKDILSSDKSKNNIINLIDNGEENGTIDSFFNSRGVTGKKAEELFVEYFNNGFFHKYQGDLIDTRDEGSGFDFKLDGNSGIVFEVKGLSSESGGISFTDKEWETAKKLEGNYNLVILTDVFNKPEIKVINNPYNIIHPTKRVYRSVAISWNIQSKEL